MVSNSLIKKLEVIVGKRLQYVTRILDLVCLGFGDIHSETDRYKKEHYIAEYALHIQCPFRICYNNVIVLSSFDLYVSNICSKAEVDWDKNNACLFDDKSLKFANIFQNQQVESVSLSSLNDLEIKTQDLVISLFVSDLSQEAWRFFLTVGDEEHIVIGGE